MRHSSIDAILRAVAAEPWLILPQKLDEILAFLELRANGVTFTAEEIAARVGEPRAASDTASARATGVAVIPIVGLITQRTSAMNASTGGTVSTIGLGRAFDEAMANPDVGSILLEVDSPGGTVNGVQELAAKIFAARGQGKKIVAIANSVTASAAYWIASAADEVVAAPSALVGGIGVYTVHIDESGMDAQLGLKRTVIKAGKFKAEGADGGPLSEEATAALQQMVDDIYGQFVGAVARHRNTTPSAVRDGYGEGRALMATRALEAGLVDRIATMEETLARMGNARRAASIGRRADLEQRRLALRLADTSTQS